MKISYQWLKELTGLDWSPEEMGDRLTLCGLACEYIEPTAECLDKVIVGEVTDLQPVEGADKIQKATVNLGSESLQLICGAPNVAVGQKVPVATIGATMANGMEVKKVRIRGVESSGMICSQAELGVSTESAGIWVLPDDLKIGSPVAEALDFHDYMMTFEITPNRPDSLSAIGIARDLAALASIRVRRPEIKLDEAGERAGDVVSVKIDDFDGCPRYAARVIKGITIKKSPWWMQKKLLAAGIRPINNIVDITNFVMLECGHPMHAFDLQRFGSSEVVVRFAKDGEKFTTLDEKVHTLNTEVLLITNGKEAVAAGGVMGGLNSEVEEGTRDILLEAAYFDPSTVRRSRRHLGLNTESSYRFERGADPNGIEYALDRAAQLMAELAGGAVLSGIIDAYPKRITPRRVALRPERCNAILGTDLSSGKMTQILSDIEFDVSGSNPIETLVPTFRPDIEREIDLIEEIGRIVGYDNIPDAQTNIGPLYTPVPFENKFQWESRSILTGAGFDEIMLHGLTDRKLAELVEPDIEPLGVTNPVTEDLDIMRSALLESALTVVQHNIAHRNLNLRLFELGKVYFPPNEKDEWIEQYRLLLLVTGSTDHTWRDKPRPLDFYDVTGALEQLTDHFRWPKFDYVADRVGWLDSETSFGVKLNGETIGYAGRAADKLLKQIDLKQPMYVAEIKLEPLMKAADRKIEYQPIPVYPAAPRDLAMIVDSGVMVGDIIAEVRKAAGPLAESIDIFDIYTGKQIPSGKKSVAIAINYRSEKGSVSSEEVDKRQQAVISSLKKNFNADIRDK